MVLYRRAPWLPICGFPLLNTFGCPRNTNNIHLITSEYAETFVNDGTLTGPFCVREKAIGRQLKRTSTGTWKACRRFLESLDSSGLPLFSTTLYHRKSPRDALHLPAKDKRGIQATGGRGMAFLGFANR